MSFVIEPSQRNPRTQQHPKKGTSSPRRKSRDISAGYMDKETQDALAWQRAEFGINEDEDKARLRVVKFMRSKMRPVVKPQVVPTVFIHKTVQQRRQRAEGTRSSAASGDSNDGDSDPEPERNPQQNPLQLLDQQSLAALLCISKKTLQNQYSVAPYTLPEAIQIPHARGPRWTIQAVQDWLANRPKHTQTLAPVAPKRKAGRPRIAAVIAAKGGAK